MPSPRGGAAQRRHGHGYGLRAHRRRHQRRPVRWLAGSPICTPTADRRDSDGDLFTGDDDLGIASLVYKWAPGGNPTVQQPDPRRRIFLRRESRHVQRHPVHDLRPHRLVRAGRLSVHAAMERRPALRASSAPAASDAALAGSALDDFGHIPRAETALLEFDTSEFGRLRLQYTHDNAISDPTTKSCSNTPSSTGRTAPIATEETTMSKLLIGAVFCRRGAFDAGARQSQRLRLRTRMGRALSTRDRRRQGLRLHRHDRRAGPAPSPGAAEPDRDSARTADIAVCTGAELEIGWLPHDRAAIGQPEDSAGPARRVRRDELRAAAGSPGRLDRAEGDIHAPGNPHIQTDPRNMLPVAKRAGRALRAARSARTPRPTQRVSPISRRAGRRRWRNGRPRPRRSRACPSPFSIELDLSGELARPEASRAARAEAGRAAVQRLSRAGRRTRCRTKPAKFVIRAAYEDDRPSEFIAEQARIPGRDAALHRRRHDGRRTLFTLYDDTINRLLAGLGK